MLPIKAFWRLDSNNKFLKIFSFSAPQNTVSKSQMILSTITENIPGSKSVFS